MLIRIRIVMNDASLNSKNIMNNVGIFNDNVILVISLSNNIGMNNVPRMNNNS